MAVSGNRKVAGDVGGGRKPKPISSSRSKSASRSTSRGMSEIANEMLKGNKSIPNPSKGSTDKGYLPPTSLDEATRQYRAQQKANAAKGKPVKPKLISSKKGKGGGGASVGGSKSGVTKRAHGVG